MSLLLCHLLLKTALLFQAQLCSLYLCVTIPFESNEFCERITARTSIHTHTHTQYRDTSQWCPYMFALMYDITHISVIRDVCDPPRYTAIRQRQ